MNSSSTAFAFEARKDSDWGDCASEYAHYSEQIGFYAGITETLRALVPPEAERLVDFGCGHGRFTRACLGAFTSVPNRRTVYLVDKFAEMLALTADLETMSPAIRFERVQDSEELERLSSLLRNPVDLIACNSSLFLGRDPQAFITRATALLKPGGSLIANIPDQDFSFHDGWRSEFSRHANKLLPSPSRHKIPPMFSREKLQSLAAAHGCSLELSNRFFPVPWQDFVSFYSIPFMGARRIPGVDQQHRLEHLHTMRPAFDEILYRWAFFTWTKPA